RELRTQHYEQQRTADIEATMEQGTSLEKRLQDFKGTPAPEDIVLPWTDEVLVPSGDIIAMGHVERLRQEAGRRVEAIEAAFQRELDKLQTSQEMETQAASVAPDVQLQIEQLRAGYERDAKEVRDDVAKRRDMLESIKLFDLPTEARVRELQESYGHIFKAGMGAEALRTLIINLDLDALALEMRSEIHGQ